MIRRLAMLLTVLGVCIIASPLSAVAFDPFSNPDPSKSAIDCSQAAVSGSAVCQDKNSGDPISGSNGALLKVTNIASYIAGAAAVIVIIVSGIRYMTSGGDSNAVSSAKNTLIGALVGIVIIVLAKTLITYVVNKL